ncbi:MAG: glycosyltransferase [Flavobacteriia bacterium]|nr:glycosyltransferase [Flavobacteriia bacterium]
MRIAYLCSSTSWGGLELNHLKNAQWMQQRGHTVWVFAPAEAPLFERAKALDLKTIPFHKQPKYYAWRCAINLVKQLRAFQITHIFIRDNRDMSLLASLKFLMGSRITTCYFMEMQLGVSKRGLFHTLRFSWVDFWFCPLPYLENQVKSMTRLRQRKIYSLPSGIEFRGLKKRDKLSAREILRLPVNQFFFGLIGRFDHQKGQLLLIEALHKAKRKDFNVVFLGEPTKNEEDHISDLMNRKMEEYRLQERVFIRPFMSEIEVFYSAIDMLVMASKSETFGMVTLEALAYGVPVLGSDAGGTPDLLAQGQFGELFTTMNAEDLAKKIDLIMDKLMDLNQDHLRQHLAKFDHQSVCENLEATLKNNP